MAESVLPAARITAFIEKFLNCCSLLTLWFQFRCLKLDKTVFLEVFRRCHQIGQVEDEFFWLVNQVEALHPEVIIEVGVYMGGSLRFWEYLLPPSGLLIGVDKTDPKTTIGKHGWKWWESTRNLALITGTSYDPATVAQVKTALKGKSADFIFLDASHDDQSVRKDFEGYVPFLRKGGLMGIHDTTVCKRFFKSLSGRKEELLAPYGMGTWWKE